MKSDPLMQILVSVLMVSAVASLGLCYLYVKDTRELRALQGQINFVSATENRRMLLASLLNDALEYSKKNPDINPLLEAAGVPPLKAAPATTNKPAPK